MIVELVTPPASSPVTIEDTMAHLNITTFDDYAYVKGLISAAVGHVEQVTGRKLVSQTWKAFYDDWPGTGVIVMPFGDTLSVSSVKYTDADGAESTLATTEYSVDTSSVPGRCVLGYDKTWPSDTLFNLNPIAVEFVTGFSAVPPQLKHAVFLLVSHWYEIREPVIIGSIVSKIPFSVSALLGPYRLNMI